MCGKAQFSSHIFSENLEKLAIRYITMGDSDKICRDQWVKQIMPNVEEFEFSSFFFNPTSKASSFYDAIIIGGSDISRSIKYIKNSMPLLHSVAKICVLNGSNPLQRSRLINGGFDDVFDIAKVSKSEAISRIFSIVRRYRLSLNLFQEGSSLENKLRTICSLHNVSDRQKKILILFLQKNNKFITYNQLKNSISDDTFSEITFNNLKVIISNLRKHLTSDCRIISMHGSGYQMIIDHQQLSDSD